MLLINIILSKTNLNAWCALVRVNTTSHAEGCQLSEGWVLLTPTILFDYHLYCWLVDDYPNNSHRCFINLFIQIYTNVNISFWNCWNTLLLFPLLQDWKASGRVVHLSVQCEGRRKQRLLDVYRNLPVAPRLASCTPSSTTDMLKVRNARCFFVLVYLINRKRMLESLWPWTVHARGEQKSELRNTFFLISFQL